MTTDAAKNSIFRFAICSRLFVLFLSFAANLIVPDHNASDVFIYKTKDDDLQERHILDYIIYTLFGGLIRWDANYFLHVAHYGYTEENKLAFFPLFPFLMRLVALPIYYIFSGFVTYGAVLLVSSVLINFLLFCKCSTTLYELSMKILGDDLHAYYAAIIFCINPGSIFFSAPYSETLYSLLTFLTLLKCFNGKFLIASLICGLSCAARSNGILNIGFILYTFLIFFIRNFSLSLPYLLTFVILLAVFVLFSLAPFYLFQLYAYIRFCTGVEYVTHNLEDSWCNDAVPLAYSYVQSHYWNVGFLRYYELKQIPNFLLAAPIIFILLAISYNKLTREKELLYKIFNLKIVTDIRSGVQETTNRLNYFIIVVHVVLLTIFCIFFVHIQVSTRMLCSSSPVFYWFIAESFKNNCDTVKNSKASEKVRSDFAKIFKRVKSADCFVLNSQIQGSVYSVFIRHYWKMFYKKDNSLKQLLLFVYILGYFVIGTVLFSNFYPWT